MLVSIPDSFRVISNIIYDSKKKRRERKRKDCVSGSVGPPSAVLPWVLSPCIPVSTLTLFCEVLRSIHNEKRKRTRKRKKKKKKKNCVCCSVGPPSAVWPSALSPLTPVSIPDLLREILNVINNQKKKKSKKRRRRKDCVCCSVGPSSAVWPSALSPLTPVSIPNLLRETVNVINNQKKRKRRKKDCVCCSMGPSSAFWPSALSPPLPVSTLKMFREEFRIMDNEKKRRRRRNRKKNCVCCSVGPPSAI